MVLLRHHGKCADNGLGAAAGSGGSNLRHLPGYRRLARGYRRRDHGRDGGTRSTQPARGETRNNVDGSRLAALAGQRIVIKEKVAQLEAQIIGSEAQEKAYREQFESVRKEKERRWSRKA